MFQNFVVPEKQRDFLRFFWWHENDPGNKIVPYRSNVHLFGARCSPSIAEFGLKFIVNREASFGNITSAVGQFIDRNFYVDDGLHSSATSGEAMAILKETKSILLKYKLELHKIRSNSRQVEEYFAEEET